VADAPLDGAANVTVAPETGFPFASVTVASSGFVKAVWTVVLCPPPPETAIAAAAPATFVSVKLAGVEMPLAVAVTA
jgi:hypothetical protein